MTNDEIEKSAHSRYQNPLAGRYASPEMSALFSDDRRFGLWRTLWIALAECEKELGLNITDGQIAEMKRFEHDIDYAAAARFERETRHDVMAHVRAFGGQAKSAMPIIHLGATSCFVTDNADLIIYRDALVLTRKKLACVMDRLSRFALKYKSLPTLGFTHMQPAQLTTVGKRACLWLQDLKSDYDALTFVIDNTVLRGVKGTTGTQASFLSLFDGDGEKVKRLEAAVVKRLGFAGAYGVTGQTYPRKYDYTVLSALSGIAQSAGKFSSDLRILQHLKEMEEPFEKGQIGSSAMAYKRNPMRSERMASLARYLVSLPVNAAVTAGSQWFERTLDDSANKRIVMGQAFLTADAILNLYLNVTENMRVYEKVIAKHIAAELPFMATEEIIMTGVKAGGDRQLLHERIRIHSMESARVVKEEGGDNDLIARLKKDPIFAPVRTKLDAVLDAKRFVGRAPEQTAEFIAAEIQPILNTFAGTLDTSAEINV
jgi:adenylosuccinate lyase